MSKETYTRHSISYETLLYGFGVELGFVDCSIESIEDLEKDVDALTDEQFNYAMAELNKD